MTKEEFQEKLYRYILSQDMISPGDKVVVGVSGGADSVALLLGLISVSQSLGINRKDIVAVHINHMIRGAEADSDEAFVDKLCEDNGIEFYSYKKDIKAYAKELSVSDEEAGRSYRYECFSKVKELTKSSKIAVAHNKNDVAETLLFNMTRGTGLNGMSSIKAVREDIIRPLLFATREEIEAYLDAMQQNYVTDRTNLTLCYDRNKIRHRVLPELLEINSKAVDHLEEISHEAIKSYEFIHEYAVKRFIDNADINSHRIIMPVDFLHGEKMIVREHIIHEALGMLAGRKKDITRTHIDSVLSLLNKATGRRIDLPYNILARLSYDKLIIELSQGMDELCIELGKEGEYELDDGTKLILRILSPEEMTELPKNNYTKVFDYDKIKDTFCIRNAKSGDYIKIDTEGSSKKLSRIFIDNKIDRRERERFRVIASGDEVLWAIGLRYNESYRIDDNTKKILYLEYIGG